MHCITYSALYSLLRVEPYLVLCCLLMPCHLKTYICICTVSSTAYGHDGCTHTLPGTTSASLTHAQAAIKVQAGLRGSHTRQQLHLQTLQPFRRLSERED